MCKINLDIEKLTDFSMLDNFYCGVEEFDDFIHNGELAENFDFNYSTPYLVKENGILVGFFSLACDSLLLDNDYKDDFTFDKSCSDDDFKKHIEKFNSKPYFPALDIAFLAVRSDLRKSTKHYGSKIVECISKIAIHYSEELGLLFLVVDAFHDSAKDYSTINFYTRCGFTRCSDLKGNTIRMYKPIF